MDSLERNLGPQPIAHILDEHQLVHHDLVVHAPEPITHKMVSRACKGRRLTRRSQVKVLNALNRTLNRNLTLRDLFNY